MLCSDKNPEPTLRRMNEAGVLGRFVPDFGKVVSMMQFNMYHHYTVDEHLIRAVGMLSDIEHGMAAEPHPLSTSIIKTIQHRRVLYVATFLHDIAKGRTEDHSKVGAQIARTLDVPLQIGENFNGPEAMAEALAAGACDYVMPDVGRIGGVTGWMQAAGLAAARGVEMSSHLVPEVSVHLLAATPTAHWLEYVDWADAILEEPMRVIDGALTPSARPGLGLAWDEAKLRRLSDL